MGRNNLDFHEAAAPFIRQGMEILHRGITLDDTNNNEIDYDHLGIHWTDDLHSAKFFGGNKDGVIIHAAVSPSHIVRYWDKDYKKYLKKHDIWENSFENETPLREDKPIKVIGVTKNGRSTWFHEAKDASTSIWRWSKHGYTNGMKQTND